MRIRPAVGFVKVRVRLPEDLFAKIEAYRSLLGGATTLDYVMAEALRAFLASDKDFRRRAAGDGRAGAPSSGRQGPGQ